MNSALENIADWAVDKLPEILLAIVAVAFSILLARYISAYVRKQASKVLKSRSLVGLYAAVTRVVIVFIGTVVALRILNLDSAVASVLAGAGIVGLALGFAFQDAASNFIAGIFLSVQDQIEVGDVIELQDKFGVVRNITLRLTEIQTPDGKYVYVPNSKVLSEIVVDYSRLGRRRVDVSVGVSYAEDLRKVQNITLDTIRGIDSIMDDQPLELYFTEFADSSVNLVVRFWVEFSRQADWYQGQSEAVVAIREAYKEHGITIPFPITTLDFDIKGGKNLLQIQNKQK